MPLPFHVYCDLPSCRLLELRDGRFQRIDRCPLSPFLAGYGYLIVEQPLADFLKSQDLHGVTFKDVVLFERSSGTEIFSHTRLQVSQFFSADQINDLQLDGPRLLRLSDEHYFVSPELKAALEESPFKYLSFSAGLEGFAGSSI